MTSNYRAAKRAQSAADLIAKLKKVEEESDESMLWIELLKEDGLPLGLTPLAGELRELCNQVTALAVTAVRTTRARMPKKAPRMRRV